MTTEPQETDDFDGFETTAGIMAYIYSKEGAEGLKALLAIIDAAKQALLRDAEELQAVGLADVASIVAEAAEQAIPERELRCPISSDHRDYSWWQENYDRRQRMKQNPGPYSQQRAIGMEMEASYSGK